MKDLFSPGSLLTVAGAVLTVIGSVAYATDSPNLSLPTIFYGIPIFLGGLALKSSELPPAKRLTPPSQFNELRQTTATAEQVKLLKDVVRWRYGQKAHLESSLESLKLWDEENPPSSRALRSTTTATVMPCGCASAWRLCRWSAGRSARSAWAVSSGLDWRRPWRMGSPGVLISVCASHVSRAIHQSQ